MEVCPTPYTLHPTPYTIPQVYDDSEKSDDGLALVGNVDRAIEELVGSYQSTRAQAVEQKATALASLKQKPYHPTYTSRPSVYQTCVLTHRTVGGGGVLYSGRCFFLGGGRGEGQRGPKVMHTEATLKPVSYRPPCSQILNFWRNLGVFWLRLGMYVMLCLCIGTVYYNMDNSYKVGAKV